MNKVAQKVGEEAVEVVIEAMDNNIDLLKSESADLLFHLMVLLAHKNLTLKGCGRGAREKTQKVNQPNISISLSISSVVL